MDWEKFCNSQHIEYQKTAASESRGYINIHCPYCGDADQGHHLGLHRSGSYVCYRDKVGHRGKNPRYLIMRLLGCSFDMADSYVSEDIVELSDFDEAVAQFLSEPTEETRTLQLPNTFRPLRDNRGRAKMYWEYLVEDRGFPEGKMKSLVKRYNLLYCDKGEWRGRIILPVYLQGELVSWTGRTVYETEELRYKTLSHRKVDSTGSQALVNIRHVLYNFDNAVRRTRKVGVIVEGPLDSINVDFFGHKKGITSVSAFGTGISPEQIEWLTTLGDNCDKLVSCGDRNAEGNVLDIMSSTVDLGIGNVDLPDEADDPAELSAHEISDLFGSLS